MSGAVGTAEARNPWLTAAAWRALFRDRPIIPLLVLLGLLVILFELGPSSVNLGWAGGIFRAAVPLAILAGCQTLAMLTGGIDLSVGAIASASGFVVATLVAGMGLPVAIVIVLVAAGTCRAGERHRRRRVQGAPADHDPRHEPGRAWPRQRLAGPADSDRRRGTARAPHARVEPVPDGHPLQPHRVRAGGAR